MMIMKTASPTSLLSSNRVHALLIFALVSCADNDQRVSSISIGLLYSIPRPSSAAIFTYSHIHIDRCVAMHGTCYSLTFMEVAVFSKTCRCLHKFFRYDIKPLPELYQYVFFRALQMLHSSNDNVTFLLVTSTSSKVSRPRDQEVIVVMERRWTG